MSKKQQRYQSAFSAGREFYLGCIKKCKSMRPDKKMEYLKQTKKAEYKMLNPRFRSIWHAGWMAAKAGIPSNKQKKIALRKRMALA